MSTHASAASTDRLRPSLGPMGIMFLALSALSPAASVYLFGVGIIHIAGTGTILAVLIGGAAAALVGLLYGELAAAFPNAGGIYPAFARILGERLAFPYILLMLTVAITNTAYDALGLADYIAVLVPGLPVLPTALVAMGLASGVAVLSVRTGAHVTGLFLAIEMAALTILTLAALAHPWPDALAITLHPVAPTGPAGAMAPLGLAGLGLGVVTAVFTCGGASWALYFAEEMDDAPRRIGRIVNWLSPMAAVLIGLPLILAVMAAPDRAAMLASPTPLALFLAQTAGPRVARLVAAGIVLAVFNALIAIIMGYGRMVYATARDGMWPPVLGRRLARIHPRLGSPLVATLGLAAVAMACTPLGERTLLILSSNENLLEYALLGVAVLVGRRRGQTGLHHRVGAGRALAWLGVLTSVGLALADWFDPDAGRPSLFVLAALILASQLYYPIMRRRLGDAPRPA